MSRIIEILTRYLYDSFPEKEKKEMMWYWYFQFLQFYLLHFFWEFSVLRRVFLFKWPKFKINLLMLVWKLNWTNNEQWGRVVAKSQRVKRPYFAKRVDTELKFALYLDEVLAYSPSLNYFRPNGKLYELNMNHHTHREK